MKKSKLALHFPSTGGGPEQGPNDSGLEHFMGDIPRHLARECTQNSIDAAAKSKTKKPVRVEFSAHHISVAELPGLDELKNTVIPACRKYYEKDPKAKRYCDAAVKVFSDSVIPVLRIADYETTGLKGADDERTGQWYSLVKSSGVSSKDAGAAGSFGIGKHAPFAASALRTVYYRTMTDDGGVGFQGASKWWSHQDSNEGVTQGTGFIGALDKKSIICRAVRNDDDIPSVFPRGEPGTDIWIPGYVEREEWEREIVRHLLSNFWLAVYQEDIEFVVGETKVRKDNLEALLQEHSEHAEFSAHHYYQALTSGHSAKAVESFPFLGEMELYLLASDEEKFPKYVLGMRKTGMVIEERRFNCRRHYVGVLLCRNDKGNAFLRSIEPPRHDKWDRERITEWGAKGAFDSMWDWVRRKVQDLNPKPSTEAVDVPDLAKYLPDLPDAEASKEGDPGINPKPVTRDLEAIDVKRIPPEGQGMSGGEGEGGGKKGNRKSAGGGTGGGGGGGGKPGPVQVKPIRLRAIRTADRKYRVIARSDVTERGDVTLQAVTDDGALEEVEIRDVRRNGKSLTREGNTIRGVEIDGSNPFVMDLELETRLPVTLTATLRVTRKEVK